MKKITTLAVLCLTLLLPACASVHNSTHDGLQSLANRFDLDRASNDRAAFIEQSSKADHAKLKSWSEQERIKQELSFKVEASYRAQGLIDDANIVAANRETAKAFNRKGPNAFCDCGRISGDPYACGTEREMTVCAAETSELDARIGAAAMDDDYEILTRGLGSTKK